MIELYQKYKGVKQKALYSVGLVGIRNITKLVVGGVSPFNIADQVTLPPFTRENVHDLYAQYTAETHQPFTAAAVKKVHEETSGQTWLVNRLGTILTVDVKPGTVDPIDEKDVEKAIQILLYEKAKLYKETFVEIVFDNVKYRTDNEDQSWIEQYGLIKKKESNALVANNIYKRRFTGTFFDKNFPGLVSFLYKGINSGYPGTWGPGVVLLSEFKKARGNHSKDDAGSIVDIDSCTLRYLGNTLFAVDFRYHQPF
jgi:hypothetical protein